MAAVNSCNDSSPQEERVVFTGKNSLSRYRDLPPTPPSRIKLLHQSEDRSKKDNVTCEEFFYSKAIGSGSFGQVYEAKFEGKKCAVKIFENMRPEDAQKFCKKLKEECHRLKKLVHPNIVLCLDVHDHQRPMMVMELMDESLTTYINSSDIRINTKLSLLHDIASGLLFLHSRNDPIIHGDLSSNNILLKFLGNNATLPMAKITDVGLVKLKYQYSSHSRNFDFMPPEVAEEPVYNTALDVFSFGGINLHVITQEWPTPVCKPATNVIFSEIQRRQKHLKMLEAKFYELTPLVEACLSNYPACRPSAAVILEKIESMLAQQNIIQRKSIDEALCEVEAEVEALVAEIAVAAETLVTADSSSNDERHVTPLHYASFNGQIDIVKILLQEGADVNAVNNNNDLPMIRDLVKMLDVDKIYYEQLCEKLVPQQKTKQSQDEYVELSLITKGNSGEFWSAMLDKEGNAFTSCQLPNIVRLISPILSDQVPYCHLLKVSNIFKDSVCKLASFNKVVYLQHNEKSRKCNSGCVVITWLFPEALYDYKCSSKSDVWSFGVLSELFTYGGKSYANMKADEIKSFVLNKKKMSQPSGCPEEVCKIMEECFDANVDKSPTIKILHIQLKKLLSKLLYILKNT